MNNYTVHRLTTIEELLYHKEEIISSLLEVSSMFTLEAEPDFWFKTICRAVTSVNAFVGVVLDDDSGKVLACGLAQDVTPIFYDKRVMAVIAVHFKKEHKAALLELQNSFERWCKSNNVAHYFFLTTRQSGAAASCFAQFGLHKKSAVFMKGIK